jgi:hypothetical protein
MKLTKAQKSEIKKVRNEIQKSQKEQCKIFDKLVTSLNIKKSTQKWNLLWDYVFNDFKDCLERIKKYD